jgi:hypothetical protein
MKIETLPNEMFILIVKYLSLDEIGNLGLSSKRLSIILKSDDVSRHFLPRSDKNLFINYFRSIILESKNMFQLFVTPFEGGFACFCPYTRQSAVGRTQKKSMKKLLLILGFLSNHGEPICLTKDISSLHLVHSKSIESVAEYVFLADDTSVSTYLVEINGRYVLYCPKLGIFADSSDITNVIGIMENKIGGMYQYQDVCYDVVCTVPHRLVGNQYAILENSKLE